MSAYEKAIDEARLAISKLRRENGLSPTASINIPKQTPEQISPTDKPMNREGALFNYVVTILLARPQLSQVDLLLFVEDFDCDINAYLGTLEHASYDVGAKLDDLRLKLDLKYQDIADEDDEEFTTLDAKSNEVILKKIAKIEEMQAKLQSEAIFYKQSDLRYLLAQSINVMLHKQREVSHETIIRRALKGASTL